MNDVNLIPSARLQTRHRRARTRRWAVVCVACVLLLVGVYLICQSRWGGAGRADTRQMARVGEQIQNYNRRIAALEREITRGEAKIEAHRAVRNQPDWSVLLAMLAKSLEDDLVLKECYFATAPQTPSVVAGGEANSPNRRPFVLEVSGLGRSQTAVSQFVLRLEKAKLFDRVKLIRTGRQTFLTGKAIGFQLECSLGAVSRGAR